MKYNSEVQYTSKKKKKGGGRVFCTLMPVFAVRFSGLPRIKRFPVYHTLVSYLGTRTFKETLISTCVVEEVSSILSLWSRENNPYWK